VSLLPAQSQLQRGNRRRAAAADATVVTDNLVSIARKLGVEEPVRKYPWVHVALPPSYKIVAPLHSGDGRGRKLVGRPSLAAPWSR